ncbi:alpha/beta hydrolase [Candidatus Saccharibacteria bacterium]|nr:alpha/beta hydrolase [Candidatus Saccharibacteria bacterium]
MKIIETQSFKIAANIKGNESSSKVAILMPGRLDTKDYANFVSHLNFLAEKGYYALAIDPPGTWDSPGSISEYTTSIYLKAVNELIECLGNRSTLLLGHSRGGATAMLASANPAVEALVVVNAAYGKPSAPNPEKVENGALKESRDIPPGDARTEEQVLFNLPLAYFEDGAKHDPLGALQQLTKPKLIVHANKDEFVTLERVKEIYSTIPNPKMFLEIECTHDYRLYPEEIKKVNAALKDFIAISE